MAETIDIAKLKQRLENMQSALDDIVTELYQRDVVDSMWMGAVLAKIDDPRMEDIFPNE